jgi:hypothetical protein
MKQTIFRVLTILMLEANTPVLRIASNGKRLGAGDDLGYLAYEYRERGFTGEPNRIDYEPLTIGMLEAILDRDGICHVDLDENENPILHKEKIVLHT